MKGREGFAGFFLFLLAVFCVSSALAQGDSLSLTVKKPFVFYIFQGRQGGVFNFSLANSQPSTKYSSLALDSPVVVFGPNVSKFSDADIKDSFDLWQPIILLGERVVMSCYYIPGSKEYVDTANCKAPLLLGKGVGRAVMKGYVVLITPDSLNQSESLFAFVPDDEANPVFGEKEVLPTPTPYPTETPAPVLPPTPLAWEVENALSSEGLEKITAEKQELLDEWINSVAGKRGINANDLRVINGANYDDNGRVVGMPNVQSRKVGGVKIPFTGIWIGGKLYTIPGESTLLVPRLQLLDDIEIVDLEPAVLEIAQRAGKDITTRYSGNVTHIILHDTAIESRLASPIDIETACVREFGIPCYNFIVDVDGTIYKIRSVGYIYIGAGREFDDGSVAISFNTSPTVNGGESNPVQQEAAARLAAYLVKQYGIDPLGASTLGPQNNLPHISGHRKLIGASNRKDPVGVDLEDFARKVADLLGNFKPVATPPQDDVAYVPQVQSTPVPVTSQQDFTRALWVDAYHSGIESKEAINKLVKFSQDNEVDLLFVQVRRRDEAYFYSGIIGKALPKGFNSLKYLLERTAPLGIKVHAWIDGGWMYPEDAPNYTKAEVQTYLKWLVEPLLKYKDLDGVHLDRMRYSDKSATEEERLALTSLVEEIHTMVKESGKKLSVAVVAWGEPPSQDDEFENTSPYTEVGQDWRMWVLLHIVDTLVPMDYHTNEMWYQVWVEYQAKICGEYGVPLVVGVPDYMLPTSADVQRYAEYAISAGANGVSYYSYASMVEKGRSVPKAEGSSKPQIVSTPQGGKWQLPVRKEDLAFVCRTAHDHRVSDDEADPAIDFCAKEDTKVYPIGAGTVIWASDNDAYGLGRWVQIFHPSASNPKEGIVSTYAHLGKILVQIGGRVSTDVPLGTIGWTGDTTFGPYVHVAVENAPDGKWRGGAPKLGQEDMFNGDEFFRELIAGSPYCRMCDVP